MTSHDAWESGTLDLIRRLEEDRLQKVEQRLLAAQRAVSTVKAEIDALHIALKVYRAEHGIPVNEMPAPDEGQAAEYRGLGAREMLHRWAALHSGQVVMREAAKFLTAAGYFRDETQAAGALYPAATRGDEFEKVARGVYRPKGQPASIVSIDRGAPSLSLSSLLDEQADDGVDEDLDSLPELTFSLPADWEEDDDTPTALNKADAPTSSWST